MQKHEQYEELCSLAAIGELNEEEQRSLDAHLEVCRECHVRCEEFSSVLRELPVPEGTESLLELRKAEDAAYRQRFFDRARNDGREFSVAAQRGKLPVSLANEILRRAISRHKLKKWVLAIPAGMALAAGCGYLALRQDSQPSIPSPKPVLVAVAPAVAKPDTMQSELMAARASAAAAGENAEVLREQNDALQESVQAQARDLRSTQSEKEQIAAALAHADELNGKLDTQFKEHDALLAQTRGELDKARADHSDAAASLAMERRAVDDLSARLKAQTDGLDHERDLLAEGRDIRDLMGARNLHIIDVFDSDAKGKNRRSFGRVFYTEGKSLIFYAFDLDQGRAVDAKYSFEAWGEQLGQPSTVKNLGVFFADDKSQKRWVLKLEDPAQIAQINSVFVTLEPNGVNAAPRGKKILYAFLGGGANHP